MKEEISQNYFSPSPCGRGSGVRGTQAAPLRIFLRPPCRCRIRRSSGHMFGITPFHLFLHFTVAPAQNAPRIAGNLQRAMRQVTTAQAPRARALRQWMAWSPRQTSPASVPPAPVDYPRDNEWQSGCRSAQCNARQFTIQTIDVTTSRVNSVNRDLNIKLAFSAPQRVYTAHLRQELSFQRRK